MDRARTGLVTIAAVALLALVTSAFVLARAGVEAVTAIAIAIPPALLFGFIGLASQFSSRAMPLKSSALTRMLVTHAVSAVAAGGLWLLVWQRWLTLSGVPDIDVAMMFGLGALLYTMNVAFHTMMVQAEASRGAEEAALRYELLAREAELKAYKSQIDPHFLFNSLNAVAALCGSNPDGAREMAQRLADFFRQTLRLGALERITLAQELELVTQYLAIEKVRFGPRLEVKIEADDAALAVMVPPLLLQPLVENGVRHGIASTLEGGTVGVAASLRNGTLHVRVENPVDPDYPEASGEGIGLRNVRGRLAAISGGRATMRAGESSGTFRVEIELPS